MHYEEKEAYLSGIIEGFQTDFNLDLFQSLSRDKDTQIRYLVAEAIATLELPTARDLFDVLLSDPSFLVRIQAIQSLPERIDVKLWRRLEAMALRDKNYLVRGYALGAFASHVEFSDVTFMKAFVTEQIARERYGFNKIFGYYALYLLGDDQSLYSLFNMFDSRNYRNKCAVLNSLLDILDDKNREAIQAFVEKKGDKQFPGSIQPLLDELREMVSGEKRVEGL